MGRILLVTGGARSGKSSFAERLVVGLGDDIVYIATARAADEEMTDRIAQHRLQRPASWRTHEAPDFPSTVITYEGQHCDGLLLDCLTMLTTNRILAQSIDWGCPAVAQLNGIEAEVMTEIEAIVTAAAGSRADLVAVTNEVGCGIVPGSTMARFFRDCAGHVNQRIAAAAAEVYLTVSGIPMRIKG
jgi:Adenosyl cobinamide kinase/adenosyl cobinamide phosphate guanylyltransferase